MEGLLILIIILFIVGILVLPIVTLVKISDLGEQIAEMRRLIVGKAEVKLPAPTPAPTPTPPLTPTPPPTLTPPPTPTTTTTPTTTPTPTTTTTPTPSTPTGVELFWQKVGDWLAVRGDFAPKGMTREFAFATRWLVRIGVMLITGSLIYFVKLSIDRGWMGPTGRVASMLFWGAVGSAAGTFLVKRTRYGVLGHAIAALGVVALYLGFGLGHRFFDPPVIASPVFAFAALAAVTVFAGVMSVYIPSPHIAVMALAGGYLVPLIAGRDSGFPLGLDVYLLVLNLGAFFVAMKRKWSGLNFLAATLAYIVCFAWSSRHPGCGHTATLVNFAFLALVHALYMTSVIVGSRFRSAAGNSLAWSGLALNACVLFGWVASVFRVGFSDRIAGLVILALVAAYAAVAALAIRRGWADAPTVNILMVFALAFFAVAPLFLFDFDWCVFAWSAIAVAASEGEKRSGQRALGVMAYVILGAAALACIFYLTPSCYFEQSASSLAGIPPGVYLLELVSRLVRVWSLPVATAVVACRNGIRGLLIPTGILAFLYFTAEAWIFGCVFMPALKSGSVTIAWTALAFAGLFTGIVRRVKLARTLSLVLLGVSVAKLLFIDTDRLATPSRVALFALTGVVLLVGAFLYMKYQNLFADDADGKETK